MHKSKGRGGGEHLQGDIENENLQHLCAIIDVNKKNSKRKKE